MPGDISINEIISNALSHRDLAVHEAEQKKRGMWEKIPELRRIDNILMKTGSRIMSASLSGGDIESKISDIERENAELLDKKKMLLVSRGIAPDYDEPQFDCKKCNDTGYTDDGRLCVCIKKKRTSFYVRKAGWAKICLYKALITFRCHTIQTRLRAPKTESPNARTCRTFFPFAVRRRSR